MRKSCFFFVVIFLVDVCMSMSIEEVESEFSRSKCSESQTLQERLRVAPVVVIGSAVTISHLEKRLTKAEVEIEDALKGGDLLSTLPNTRSKAGRQIVVVEGVESPEFCSTKVNEKEKKIWLLKKGYERGELLLDSSLVDFTAENVELAKKIVQRTIRSSDM